MPDVDAVGRRTTTSIEEKGLAALVAVEDELKIPVRKDDASPEEVVRALAGHTLEAGKQLVVDPLGAELVDQLVVVDRLDHTVLTNFSRDLLYKKLTSGSVLYLFSSPALSQEITNIVRIDRLLGRLLQVLGNWRLVRSRGVDIRRHGQDWSLQSLARKQNSGIIGL